MRKYLCLVTLLISLLVVMFSSVAAEKIKAAAYMSPVDKPTTGDKAKYGYVIFEQEANTQANENQKNTNPVKVDVSNLRGFQPGLYGFHIHQYGDLVQPGTHFIPICTEPDPTTTAPPSSCADDATHGFPLNPNNNVYQAGDLGNIQCTANGRCKICACTVNKVPSKSVEGVDSFTYNAPTCTNCQDSQFFKGEKFTLQPPPPNLLDDIDRSVVARAIVIHEKTDHGGPPFGGVRTNTYICLYL